MGANRGLQVWHCRNMSNRLAFRHRLFLPTRFSGTLDRNLGDSELIHVHELRSFLTVAARRAARRRGIPYVVSTHGGLLHLGKRHAKVLFDTFWGSRVIRDAAGLIAVSEMEAEQMRSFGIRNDRIHLLPNPIDTNLYDVLPASGQFRERWGLGTSKLVLFLGRLNWIKGADLLITAFEKLSGDVHLVLAGPDDGHRAQLDALLSPELAKRVTFTGRLDHADKLAAFVDADICVVPSRSEIFGMVVLEALACRRGVLLSSACGLIPELEDEECVRVFENGNSSDLARKLDTALGSRHSKGGVEAARQFVLKGFSAEAVAARARSIYTSIYTRFGAAD